MFLTKSELVKLMQWKLAVRSCHSSSALVTLTGSHMDPLLHQRGKWRPRLESLVASNSEASVETATRTPSLLVSPDAGSDSIDIKTTMVTKMCELKGVGPATASAILAALDPRSEPFMSDQALEFVHSRKDDPNERAGKREYTMKAWRVFREQMQTRRDEEEWESMEDLEKALWSWGTEREFGLASEDNNKRRGAHGDAGEKERKKTRKAETLTGSATKKRKS